MAAASSQLQFWGCFDFSSAQGECRKNLAVSGCNSLVQEVSPGFVKHMVSFGRPPNTMTNQEFSTGSSWLSLLIPSSSLSPANSQHPQENWELQVRAELQALHAGIQGTNHC